MVVIPPRRLMVVCVVVILKNVSIEDDLCIQQWGTKHQPAVTLVGISLRHYDGASCNYLSLQQGARNRHGTPATSLCRSVRSCWYARRGMSWH